MARYVYLGDRLTAPELRGAACDPVRRADGRCVVGAGKALVRLADGRAIVVLRRRLRLADCGRAGRSRGATGAVPHECTQPIDVTLHSKC